jgi:hypothetical protein
MSAATDRISHVHGANFGLRAWAYLAAGGLRPLRTAKITPCAPRSPMLAMRFFRLVR